MSGDTTQATELAQLRTVEEISVDLSENKETESKKSCKLLCTVYNIKDCVKQTKRSRRSPNKIYLLLYNLIMPFCVITTCGLFAYLFNLPFIFPSLAPTVFLHFAIPNKAPSSPKNTLIGHAVGIFAGSLSLQITNLYDNDAIFIEQGIEFKRIWCSSLSVALCCVLMILFNVEHPPSAATTLIISLGILKTPKQLIIMIGAVLLITIQAFIINRCLRKDAIYPFWSISDEIKKNKIAVNDEDEDENLISLKGYSNMRLSRMNIQYRKLQNMMDNLCIDNFLEYFEICKDLESEQDMILLIKFAKIHKERLMKIKNYSKQIPYSTQILIQHCC